MAELVEVKDPNLINNLNQKKEKGFFSKSASFVKDLVSGDKRTEFKNLPELSSASELPLDSRSFKVGTGMFLTPDMEDRMQIIKSQYPDVKFNFDKFNNPIVTLASGDSYYMNKPGFSMQDATDLASEGVKYIGGGKLANKLFKPKGMIGKIGSQSTMAGAVSLGGDVGAKTVGAEDNVDFQRAGLVAGLTGIFEPIGALGKAGWNKFFGNPKYVDKNGNLTKKGEKTLKDLGYDPKQFDSKQANLFQVYMNQGQGAKMSASAVEEGGFGIPYYKAQLQNDKNLLGILERGRKGAFGSDVQEIILNADHKQQYAIVKALEDIQQDLRYTETNTNKAKYQGILTDDEAGDLLISSLKKLDDQYTANINKAYDAVDKDGYFTGNSLLNIATRVNKNIRTESIIDAQLTPYFNKAYANITKFIRTYRKKKQNDVFDYATIKKIDIERRKIGEYLNTAEKGSLDFKNLTILKKEYDKFFEDAFDQALFSGNPEALANLKLAQKIVNEHKSKLRVNNKFNKGIIVNDDGGRIVNKIIAEEITPREALNYIFGQTSLGNNRNSLKIINKFVNIFGKESAEFDALRQSAFNRLVGNATNREGFSSTKFLKELDKALDGNGSDIMKKLYSADEIELFRKFGTAVQKTITPRDVLNPSGTANALLSTFSGGLEALAKIVGFNLAGMQGLIGSKIVMARGKKAVTDATSKKITETIGTPTSIFARPSSPSGIIQSPASIGIEKLENKNAYQDALRNRGLLQ